MSQHKLILNNGRLLLYGADKPTGGFFLSEFYTEEEQKNLGLSQQLASNLSALTLTELAEKMKEFYDVDLDNASILSLRDEWMSSPNPTRFQHGVSEMFGVNLKKLLERTNNELLATK